MDLYNVLVQGIGIIGIISSIISFQCAKHKKIIFFRTLNELLFGIQYMMLGAYTGMMMNFIGCIRNSIFSRLVEKNKSTLLAQICFSALFLFFIIITWAGAKSLLSGIAKVMSTIAYANPNPFFVRIIIFITSISWLVYNYIVGSYAGCACELFTLISIVIGIIRIDIPNLAGKKCS